MKKLALNGFASSEFVQQVIKSKILQAALAMTFLLLFVGKPAYAHHPLGGRIPANFFEGFMSGLGHPVIGIDHLTFVVAVGLMAALKPKSGIFIPVAFIIATLAGTGIHLQSLDLPAPEIVISASVLAFGIMLAMKDSPNLGWLMGTAAIAGIFHGYAYGEAIVGAQMTPLVAYLAGFAIIQLIISLIAFQVGKLTLKKIADRPSLMLRFAGFTIAGIGGAFLSSAVLG